MTDIAATIGSGSKQLGYLIANGGINRWAKNKPINYPTREPLSDTQRRGTSADNANGIYYGVKAASSGGSLADLHKADYTYIRPTGGTNSPYRVRDFDGYDHNAKPTLSCLSVPEEVYYNIDGSLFASIIYDYNGVNTTGIDMNDFLPTNEAKDIGDYYPCVLVDNWARAMYNKSYSDTAGSKQYTPLKYANQWWINFGADIDISTLEQDKTRQVTFFLIRSIYGPSAGADLREWTNVGLIINTENGITIPDGINLSIPFSYYTEIFKLINISIFNTGSKDISIYWDYEVAPTEKTKFQINLQAWDKAGGAFYGAGTKDWTYSPGGLSPVLLFTFKELGLDYIVGSVQVEFRATIKQYKTVSGTELYPDYTTARQVLTITG